MNENLFLKLAALGTVANPDLEVEALCPPSGSDQDFAWTGILDKESNRWTVLASRTTSARDTLEKREKILAMLANYHDAHRIAFEVPRIVGRVSLPAHQDFHPDSLEANPHDLLAVLYRQLPGNPLDFNQITQDSDLARNLGRAIASLHEMPGNLVEHAGFPSASTEEIRASLRESLSEAVATGLVPPTLQARWEQALDEDAWWRFHPTFVHGSLDADKVLTSDSRILAISGFSEVCVDDPAKDFAWLATELPEETVDSIFDAYHLGRAEGADSFLRQRTDLYTELSLIDWLNWGVSQADSAIIADAQELLAAQLDELEGDFSMTGKPLFETDTEAFETDTATIALNAKTLAKENHTPINHSVVETPFPPVDPA